MNDTQGIDRDFIEYVVKQIVDEPELVVVERRVDELGVLITLRVGPHDMGKIIGKSGQTAKALRVLLRVIGSKNDARVNLKIIEPDGSEVRSNAPASMEPIAAEMPLPDDTPAEVAPQLEEDVADQHADMPEEV